MQRIYNALRKLGMEYSCTIDGYSRKYNPAGDITGLRLNFPTSTELVIYTD
jgi:hypothetical protein